MSIHSDGLRIGIDVARERLDVMFFPSQLLADGGLFVEPTDESALAGAISRILVDEALRNALGTTAHEKASALTWEAAAQATREALAAVARSAH